jgi:hypothetical protein
LCLERSGEHLRHTKECQICDGHSSNNKKTMPAYCDDGNIDKRPLVGVLALQGAFEEHQACLEAVGCRTRQVKRNGEIAYIIENPNI